MTLKVIEIDSFTPTEKRRFNELENKMHNIMGKEYSLIEADLDNKKIVYRHDTCNHLSTKTFMAFRATKKCNHCGLKNREYRDMKLKKEFDKITDYEFDEIPKYNKEIIKLKHIECGGTFVIEAGHFLKFNGCRCCDSNYPLTIDNMKYRIAKYSNNQLKLTKIINYPDEIEVEHTCGERFKDTYYAVNQKKKCPICKERFSLE